MKEIAVALGGGGAKGNSHIGVLRRLEAEGYRIAAIAGTSIGGLIAAFYAAGYSPVEIENIFSEVDQSKLYELGLHAQPGLLGLGRVSAWLDEMLGEKTFADTRIPCALTAADLNCNCEVTLSSGRLKDAVLASIAVPGIFPPYKTEGRHLVDGGVLNPVPVSLARSLAPKLPVIAVALSSPLVPTTHHLPMALPSVIPDSFIRRITRLNVAQAMNIFLQSVDMSNQAITELRLKIEPPDVLVRPAVSEIGLLDQVIVADIARLGEKATEAVLPDLERVMQNSKGLFNRLFGRKRK
ncbi:MAG: hypothetical protein HN855_04540 [Anaerolineae bacterium]|jgi:NTE family protein|nr:hypothetical protein [Anaerolineae bacterium]MBT7070363.1 hypothetical protein [Anaerolineae bacterium]MBT7324405.1 hypothetical protein [Anaerolineae bacterium]